MKILWAVKRGEHFSIQVEHRGMAIRVKDKTRRAAEQKVCKLLGVTSARWKVARASFTESQKKMRALLARKRPRRLMRRRRYGAYFRHAGINLFLSAFCRDGHPSVRREMAQLRKLIRAAGWKPIARPYSMMKRNNHPKRRRR